MNREDFQVSQDFSVRFRDCDAMGHVNNAIYLTYFEEARIEYFRTLWQDSFVLKDNIYQMQNTDFNFIVSDISVSYKAPAFFGQDLTICIRIPTLSKARFEFDYLLLDHANNRVVATGNSKQVAFDYHKNKLAPLSDEFKKRVGELEKSLD